MSASPPSLSGTESLEDRSERGGQANQFVRLQRAVVKLVFSFHGQNPQLDERLKRLGLILKSTPKSVAALTLIDEVVDHVIAADLGHSGNAVAARHLGEFLGQLQFEHEAVADGRALQRRLGDASTQEDLERLTRDATQLVNRQLKAQGPRTEAPAPPRADEPLLRLLSTLRTEGDLQTTLDGVKARMERARNHSAWIDAAEEAAAALTFALAGQVGNRTSNATSDGMEATRQPLLRVLDAVDPGVDKDGVFAGPRLQLAEAKTQLELMLAARSLGEALIGQRQALELELKELGGFLSGIARRVEDFRTNLRHSSYTHDDSIKNSTQFQTTLQTHVEHIKGRIIEEKQLSQLKDFVTDELIKLEDTFDHHVRAENRRHHDARAHVVETLRRLAELENEMAKLRSDFDEQQSLSMIDPLTGIYNRLGYTDGIGREFARFQRQGGALSIAIFDLDFFKNINDQFGHATGDKVLTSVAALLRKHVRGVDLICRYGGEEFVLVMPETNLEGAATVAEKLRSVVGSSQFRFKDTPVPVTMSCGVATFRGEDTIDDVFERADRALYRAKNLGRNRYCLEEVPALEVRAAS